MNLLQNSQYSWNIFLFRKSIWVLLELVRRRTQNFTLIDQEKQKIKQVYNYWNPMTTKFIMQTFIYVISTKFLLLSGRCYSWRNVPSWLFPKGLHFKLVWLYVLACFSQMNVMFLIIKYRLFLHKINFCLPIKGRIHSQVEPEIAFTCTSLI